MNTASFAKHNYTAFHMFWGSDSPKIPPPALRNNKLLLGRSERLDCHPFTTIYLGPKFEGDSELTNMPQLTRADLNYEYE